MYIIKNWSDATKYEFQTKFQTSMGAYILYPCEEE